MQQKDYDNLNQSFLRDAKAAADFLEGTLGRVRGITGQSNEERCASECMEDVLRIKERLAMVLK